MQLATSANTRVGVTALQVVWAACALAGLLAVGVAGAGVPGLDPLVADLLRNPVTQTVAADLLFLAIPALIFAVVEARRLGMRAPWIWAALGLLLPAACLVPVFFLFRERALLRLGMVGTARR